MDDAELVHAFVWTAVREGGEGRLKIELDCLVLDAWWPVAFRVAPRVFAVRADEPSDPTTAVEEVKAEVAAMGLVPVATNPPLLHVITLAEIAWGLVGWTVWAPDRETAELEMQARAGADPMLAPPTNLPL